MDYNKSRKKMTGVSSRVTEKTMKSLTGLGNTKKTKVMVGWIGKDNVIELSWLRNVKSLILPLCLYDHWQTT